MALSSASQKSTMNDSGVQPSVQERTTSNASAMLAVSSYCVMNVDSVVYIGANADEKQRQSIPTRLVGGVHQAHAAVALQQPSLPLSLVDKQQSLRLAANNADVVHVVRFYANVNTDQ